MLLIAITIILSLSGSGIFFVLSKQGKLNKSLFFKITAILLFVLLGSRLLVRDAFDYSFNLLLFDITTELDGPTTWIFSQGFSLFLLLLKWLSLVVVIMMVVNGRYQNRYLKHLVGFLGIIIAVLNMIHYNEYLYAINGEYLSVYSLNGIQFVFEQGLILLIALASLTDIVLKKLWLSRREVGIVFIIFITMMLSVMPPSLMYNLFGNLGHSPKNFSVIHLIELLTTFILLIGIYLIFRKKKQETKNLVLSLMILNAFVIFFSQRNLGMGSVPIHLCNMAIIIMLIADVGNFRGAFYFTYFANVIGALIALFLPNSDWDAFHYMAIKFFYAHTYAFIVPILGVAFGRFSKPTLKDMYKAMLIFTAYFIGVITINAWMNNFTEVDYFYVYSDYVSSMLGLRDLQFNYVYEIVIKDIKLRFFYLYQPLFYLTYLIIMWLSWYVYDLIFQFFDENKTLKAKELQLKLERKEFISALSGRSIDEPVYLGGIHMISFQSFSKRYGNAKKYAVQDFSLEVKKGEVFGFIGHNGAGKSTAIKSLVGIQAMTSGDIFISGYSIKNQPLEAKLNLGYVSDNHAVYEKLTGREYINYVADLYNVPAEIRDERLNKMAKRLSLSHALDQESKSYSHGMKQKLVVIASLIHDPDVWVLDEPLTGLDPISSIQIKKMMEEHANKGKIVFFSSHIIEVVEKICDRVAIINDGKLLDVYTKEELINNKISIEDIYETKIMVEENA